MDDKKCYFRYYTISIAMLLLVMAGACENKNDGEKAVGEHRVDSISTDTALHNAHVEMEEDNTIAKDSASNREDLGGGSQ